MFRLLAVAALCAIANGDVMFMFNETEGVQNINSNFTFMFDPTPGAFQATVTQSGSAGAAGDVWMNISGMFMIHDAWGDTPLNTLYIAHVHNQDCSFKTTSAHWKYDPCGPTIPSNEIWANITSGATNETAFTFSPYTSTAALNLGVKSIIIHFDSPSSPYANKGSRLFCIPLYPMPDPNIPAGPTVPYASCSPTAGPTAGPTAMPSAMPSTSAPTTSPTSMPSAAPSNAPTSKPSNAGDTLAPSAVPTTAMPTTMKPTTMPSDAPSNGPTSRPSNAGDTNAPTASPTTMPSAAPTASPTNKPSNAGDTLAPTNMPTTMKPTSKPSSAGDTNAPTAAPSTLTPTKAPVTSSTTAAVSTTGLVSSGAKAALATIVAGGCLLLAVL